MTIELRPVSDALRASVLELEVQPEPLVAD
jgi:hypothetical protein